MIIHDTWRADLLTRAEMNIGRMGRKQSFLLSFQMCSKSLVLSWRQLIGRTGAAQGNT